MNNEVLCATIGASLPPLFECASAPREGMRVRTPLMYPDGGVIDVYVVARGAQYCVTDFGETLGWLRMQTASPQRSPKQNRMIEDACQTLGVRLDRGQLILRTDRIDSLAGAVLLIAQAALRVSDLWFTLRTRAVETLADEVGDWLAEREVPFERSVREQGRSGQIWSVDYRTRTSERTALVFLLTTGSRAASRRIAEHVLAGCVDLSHLKTNQQGLVFISLFDDASDVWHEEDFNLVEQQSEVARWSRPDEFEQILHAAWP